MTLLKPDKGLLLVAKPSIIGDVSFSRSGHLVLRRLTSHTHARYWANANVLGVELTQVD